MALPVKFCFLTVLCAYLAVTAQADCGTDCAFCAVQDRFRKSDLNPTMCMWQCEADFVGGSSWGPCRELLQSASASSSATAATSAAAAAASNLESADIPSEPQLEAQPQDSPLHQLAKKYGGFMKRYGGFMKRYGGFMKRYGGFMKKSDEAYAGGLEADFDDDVDHGREILTFRTERGRAAANAAEADDREESEAVAKRYGGFMRRSSGARPLQKRYGGFMRRVGWPEWLEEKRYGGFMRRSFGDEGEGREEGEEGGEEEQEPEVEKRYGGFMGY
ncbi:proenkephalin b [Engraulis encrasicolus]|uniref:proenkephalin b n=1 Tax=Engraulis encrasicolus TaxID=184585 RepID=UPI002FD0CC22